MMRQQKSLYVVTFADFEIRYLNIRKQNPQAEKCSVHGCSNRRDSTPLMGEDTCCAYHRLLFDFWSSERAGYENPEKFGLHLRNQKARRTAFTRWRNKTGKEACDRIVLRLANEGINWEC